MQVIVEILEFPGGGNAKGVMRKAPAKVIAKHRVKRVSFTEDGRMTVWARPGDEDIERWFLWLKKGDIPCALVRVAHKGDAVYREPLTARR